ncbi:Uncharacterized protein APZ42_013036 [Daphnia magna]|uniref:Uncharacterized protein n=1 Tax=Daphnia magna TaxID=35525 RepID=A0A162R8K1_9CRUS|nr:Uncharacterized protein APZ42_013036 [Daphnia magna]
MFRKKKNQTKELANRSCFSGIVNGGCTDGAEGKRNSQAGNSKMYFKTSPFAPKSLCILVGKKHKCLTQACAIRKETTKTRRVLSGRKWASTKFELDALSPLFFVDPENR